MKRIISFLLRRVPRKYLQLFSHWVMKVVAVFYAGNNNECSVCGHNYRKFLPYGRIHPRSNALCPSCLSLERHRLLWMYLKQKTDFFTAKHKVLHIAPELSFINRFEKMDNLDYITGDIESPLAKVMMDIHDIPFEENSFDVAFCNHVMEHVEDDIKAMSELYRVLKPGGWAIIQVPFFHPIPEKTYEDPAITGKKEREIAYGQDDHVRKYGLDYSQRLESAGFRVKVDDYVKTLSEKEILRFALPANEDIFLCIK